MNTGREPRCGAFLQASFSLVGLVEDWVSHFPGWAPCFFTWVTIARKAANMPIIMYLMQGLFLANL